MKGLHTQNVLRAFQAKPGDLITYFTPCKSYFTFNYKHKKAQETEDKRINFITHVRIQIKLRIPAYIW